MVEEIAREREAAGPGIGPIGRAGARREPAETARRARPVETKLGQQRRRRQRQPGAEDFAPRARARGELERECASPGWAPPKAPSLAGIWNVVKALKAQRLRAAANWFIAGAKKRGRARQSGAKPQGTNPHHAQQRRHSRRARRRAGAGRQNAAQPIGRDRRRDDPRRQGLRRDPRPSGAGARVGGDARRRRSADQGASRRRLGAGDADRRERGRAGAVRRRAAATRIGGRPKRGRSPASPRSLRSPRARAASASRPPPAISRSASPRSA